MTTVDDIDTTWLNEKVRLPEQGNVEFHLADARITLEKNLSGGSLDETIVLVDDEGYEYPVGPDEKIERRAVGYAAAYADGDNELAIAGKVYEKRERAEEESLPTDQIVEVRVWA